MAEKIDIHKRNIEARLEKLKEWKVAEEDKQDLLRFLHDLSLGKVNRGKRISENRQMKYLDLLKAPLIYWNKPVSSLEIKDTESFEKDLMSNKLLSYKKKPYSHESKRDIKIAIKIYLKWKLGELKATELCGWFDTRRTAKTPEYLKETEIIKLYKACKTAKERYILAMLFDSGARAEEFLNIRYEDIQLPEKGDSFVKVALKEEYSKTKGRTISLYWNDSLEAVRDYLKERESLGLKPSDQFVDGTYDSIRFFLMRLGKKILKKSIHFHLFRHSSATYYANKLNRQELCYRYGWAFSSDMPDIYISRAGMQNKDLDEKFHSTELEGLQKSIHIKEQKSQIEIEEIRKEAERQKEINENLMASIKNTSKLRNDVLVELESIKQQFRKEIVQEIWLELKKMEKRGELVVK
jgi:integrase